MFQVASHPSAFALHSHGQYMAHQQQHLPTQSPAVQLPRTLSRPRFTDVSRDALIAASPDLADVPPEYIRRGLRQNPTPMLCGVNSVSLPPSLPRSQLTSTIKAPLRPSSSEPAYPTHLLAISPAKSSGSSSEQIHLFAIHSVVFAANCARLPALPASSPSPSVNGNLTLPVLPFSLPSPAAFHVVHQYLYTHRLDAVMTSLGFPSSPFIQNLTHQTVRSALQSPDTLHQLAVLLCQQTGGNLGKLTGLTVRVKDLWQDMVSLGLYEMELWDTLDLAWEILLGSLNLAAVNQQ
ncbi:Clampless protein 1 [Leucoagaricus sp. SymC.cos]|nr:Clampless protein 1 [Leucoagaricus sp. SymC.cos]